MIDEDFGDRSRELGAWRHGVANALVAMDARVASGDYLGALDALRVARHRLGEMAYWIGGHPSATHDGQAMRGSPARPDDVAWPEDDDG